MELVDGCRGALEGGLGTVGVNAGRQFDAAVSHELARDIDRNPGRLQIGAIGMPQTVGGKIFGHHRLNDLIAIDQGAHLNVQRPFEALPITSKRSLGVMVAGCWLGKQEIIWSPLPLPKVIEQRGRDGDGSNPGTAFGGADGVDLGRYCLLDMQDTCVQIQMPPAQSSRFAGPQAAVQHDLDPKTGGMPFCELKNGCPFLIGDGTMAAFGRFGQDQIGRRIGRNQSLIVGDRKDLFDRVAQTVQMGFAGRGLVVQYLLTMDGPNITQP